MNIDTEHRYFKLPTGYLHVDEAGLVFTRSGNWEEAAKAQERSGRANIGRIVRVVLGVALIIVGMAFYAAKGLRSGGSAAFVFALGGAALGVYKLINKVQDDFAHTSRIPFSKVRSIHLKDGRLVIAFINGKWKEDEVKVELSEADAQWVQGAWASQRAR